MPRKSVTSSLALFLSLFAAVAQAQTMRVQSVTIKSAWGGWSPSRPEPVELIIRRQSDGFYSNTERIDTGLVEALVSVLSESPLPKPQASNLGITEAWLNANVDLAGTKSLRYQSTLTAHLDTYRGFFKNLADVERLLPSLFAGVHTDDYPRVGIELRFDGGEVWLASSDSQYDFMIPWKVRARSATSMTFNADLSRKVANLLPLKSLNRDRLSGEFFMFRLAEAAMARLEEQWLNPALSVLRPQYDVERSEITPSFSIHYGQDWKNEHPQQENALFVLRRESFPRLFRDWIVLPFRNETVHGANDFLKTAAKYEILALSIPWLNEIRQDRSMPIDLQFVQERSFSERALSVFAKDMSDKGRTDLTKMVAAVQEDTALIVAQGAYCLILPDKKVILWRFHNPPGSLRVLKWNREDISSTKCATYQSIAEWCAGAVISSDGNLVR